MSDNATFPTNWQIARDFDPNDNLISLKGKDYLNVQMRMVWFIRDQRALIVAGLATQAYRVDSDLVELDRTQGWAHFRATVTDVLGNSSTAYGSESTKDFGDFIEKAATKALGRALIGLGYGTQFAPEMDEGERVVDAPVERRQHAAQSATPARATATPAPASRPAAPTATRAPQPTPAPSHSAVQRPTDGPADEGATVDPKHAPVVTQVQTIKRLCDRLGKPVPVFRTFDDAKQLIQELSAEVKAQQAQQQQQGA